MAGKHRTLRKLGAVALMTVSACSLLAPDDDDFLGHLPSAPEVPGGEGGTGNAQSGGQGGRARGGSPGVSSGAAGEAATSSGGSANGASGGAGETNGGEAGHDDGNSEGGWPGGGVGGTGAGGMGIGGSSGAGLGGALGGSSSGGAGGVGVGGVGLGGNGVGGTSVGGSGAGGSPNPCGTVTPACTPGQRGTERRACTDCTAVMQTRTRTCSATCTWGAWGSWSACGVCSRDEFQCCGNRGWQFCNPATCQWHPCRDNCAADSTCDC